MGDEGQEEEGVAAEGAASQRKQKRRLKTRPPLEPGVDQEATAGAQAAAAGIAQCKFVRALGSVDFRTREEGVAALARWLRAKRDDLRAEDMLKVWKGLYVCFWHSDKAPVQARGRRGRRWRQACSHAAPGAP